MVNTFSMAPENKGNFSLAKSFISVMAFTACSSVKPASACKRSINSFIQLTCNLLVKIGGKNKLTWVNKETRLVLPGF